MRRLVVVFVGLTFVLGVAATATAGEAPSGCCVCACTNVGAIACNAGEACSDACELWGETEVPVLSCTRVPCSEANFCPTFEAGPACADGIDNEPDGLADAADPDCQAVPAPVLNPLALLALLAGLLGFGVYELRRR